MSENRIGIYLDGKDESRPAFDAAKMSAGELKASLNDLGIAMAEGGEKGNRARQALVEINRELGASDKVANTAAKAWQNQNDILLSGVNVMTQFSSMVNHGMSMMNQYNTEQIRMNQLTSDLADSQDKVTAAIDARNSAESSLAGATAELAALTDAGVTSGKEYETATKKVEEAKKKDESATTALAKAQRDLADATDKVQQAHNQENMMIVGFIAQAPMFLKGILNMQEGLVKFGAQLLASQGPLATQTTATGAATTATEGFNLAILHNPIVLVVAAIVAAIALLYAAWATNFLGMREPIEKFYNESVKPIIEALGTIFGQFVDNVLKPLAAAVMWVFQTIIGPVIKGVAENVIIPALQAVVAMIEFVIWWITETIKHIQEFLDWVSQANSTAVTNNPTGGPPIGPPGGLVPHQTGALITSEGPYWGHPGEWAVSEGERNQLLLGGRSAISIGQLHVHLNNGGRREGVEAGEGLIEGLRNMGYAV